MPFMSAKCPNCGGSLTVDDAKDAAICEFCGSPFIVEKAINHFNVTNNNQIKADVVNIYGDNSADFEIVAGELKSFKGASTNVVIPNTVKLIGEKAFYNCSGLTSVIIPDSVTSIGVYAFAGCSGLTSVIIPDSVTSIGVHAFEGCSGLTSVTIPDSVTSIGETAFERCSSLTSITLPNSIEIDWVSFCNCSSLTSITLPNSMKIRSLFLRGCSNLTSVTIPNSVTTIGDRAFENCSSLTSVTIPNSVTKIGDRAFENCSSLTSITIPDSVTKIGDSAFKNCSSLTSVTIPNSVTKIGDIAFENCSSLTSITIPDSVTFIYYGTFSGCSNLKSVSAHRNIYIRHEAYLDKILPKGCVVTYREDSSSQGCYVATAVYGGYDCPQVWVLRRFRDYTLAKTWYGRAFIHFYYAVSPTLVKWFGKTEWFKNMWKPKLDRMVKNLQEEGVEDTPYQDMPW